jgi:GT2 family glycosyltransferase
VAETPRTSFPLVYVLVLNWRTWSDTIECLESVFRSEYPNYRVVVCDNGSENGSLEQIVAWAQGRVTAPVSPTHPLQSLTSPPVPKPLSIVRLDRATAEAGGSEISSEAPLVLIGIGRNLGYAGGNNVGMRYALARDDFSYVWLLNPDTVVAHEALSKMVAEMDSAPAAGLCGSTVLFYDDPHRVQALGGAAYYKWLGFTRLIGKLRRASAPIAADRVRASLSMILGASTLVSKRFLQDVGLMSEEYFLFSEEIDWATRAKNRYELAYAPESIVYHRQGRCTGLGTTFRKRSVLAEHYMAKSRLAFTRKYYPFAQVTVRLTLLFIAVCRILMGQWGQAKANLAAVMGRP